MHIWLKKIKIAFYHTWKNTKKNQLISITFANISKKKTRKKNQLIGITFANISKKKKTPQKSFFKKNLEHVFYIIFWL